MVSIPANLLQKSALAAPNTATTVSEQKTAKKRDRKRVNELITRVVSVVLRHDETQIRFDTSLILNIRQCLFASVCI